MERIGAVLLLLVLALPTQAAVEMFYLHNDHLGTPRVVTNQLQQVVWKGHLKPFGETQVEIETITNHRRFSGQRFDIESRLHYNYFRDYDPKTGRYIQSDPIGLRGGLNTYAYVGGNPLSYVDPLGLETCILITTNSAGFGNHAALYADRGLDGKPFIYDPAGTYAFERGGGSGELVSGSAASIPNFKKYHKDKYGDDTEVECKETSAEEEAGFEKLAIDSGGAPIGGLCAAMVSTIVGNSRAFPNVNPPTFFPNNLIRDARK